MTEPGILTGAEPQRPTWRTSLATGWLCVRAVAVLAALPIALSVLPVARLVALLTPARAGTRRPAALTTAADLIDRLVDRRPFRFWGHCLRRSLALYYVATRTGYPVRIAFGIGRDDAGVIGHGWLELDGAPFLEPRAQPEARFVVMERMPRLPNSAGRD